MSLLFLSQPFFLVFNATSAKNMTTWNTQISTKKCVMKFVSSSLWHEYQNKPLPLFNIMLCNSAFLSDVKCYVTSARNMTTWIIQILRQCKKYIPCNFYLIHQFFLFSYQVILPAFLLSRIHFSFSWLNKGNSRISYLCNIPSTNNVVP